MDAKTWNKQHPVGTPVTAYPSARTGDDLICRSPKWVTGVLSTHSAHRNDTQMEIAA